MRKSSDRVLEGDSRQCTVPAPLFHLFITMCTLIHILGVGAPRPLDLLQVLGDQVVKGGLRGREQRAPSPRCPKESTGSKNSHSGS